MLIGLLKINLLLALLAMVYYFALRKLTFYQLNRFYLLVAIVCSIVYPFIDLSSFFTSQQQTQLTQFLPTVPNEFATKSNIDYPFWLMIIFFTGVAVMAVRLMRQFISLYWLHKSAASGSLYHIPVMLLQQTANPFSFGKYIYINPTLHTSAEQKTILAHEKIHVRQWHTLDILLSELLLLGCWFNPAAWFIKKAVRENIEFITDEAVLQKGFDKKLYQYNLLRVSAGTTPITIVNEFTLQDIKKRIQMMNGRRSSRLGLVSYVALPLLLTTALLFTISDKKTKELVNSLTTTIGNIATNDDKTINETKIPESNHTLAESTTKEIKTKKPGIKAAPSNRSSTVATQNKSSKAIVEAPVSQRLTRQTAIDLPQENANIKKVQPYRLPENSGNNESPARRVTGVPLPPANNSNSGPTPIVVVGYPTQKKHSP